VTTRALVLDGYGGRFAVQERDDVLPGRGDAVVRVRANGLCGTDLKIVDGRVPSVQLPAVIGHEFAGEVVEVGEGPKRLVSGDHVAVHVYIGCQECPHCRTGFENYCPDAQRLGFELVGGFSELVVVPTRNLVKLRADVPFEHAAIMSGSIATPLHGIRTRAQLQLGETAVIIGIGGLGVHAIQLARAMGARVIAVGRDPGKLELAGELGADDVVGTTQEPIGDAVRRLTRGRGADVVVEAVGGAISEVLAQALDCLAPAGRLLVLGYEYGQALAVDTARMIYGQWKIIASRSSTRQDLADVADLVQLGVVRPVIDRTYPLSDAEAAFDDLRSRSPVGRIVLLS
jgi:2-desacetyl-2-hydroxyethyl bacteriochlorophyllide A dehydrogenase